MQRARGCQKSPQRCRFLFFFFFFPRVGKEKWVGVGKAPCNSWSELSVGLGGSCALGGGGEARRLLAPGSGQQVREDDDFQNTSRQP